MWIYVSVVLLVLVYWVLIRPHNYWTRKGVPQLNPVFIFGNMWPQIVRKYSAPELSQAMYNSRRNSRYIGVYQLLRPALLLRDPELIKQIAVKDFDYFLDHVDFVDSDVDPLIGKNLLSLTGMQWKEMRSTLSPCFSSNKMKYMFSLMSQNGEQFVRHFLKQGKEVINVEMKDVMSRFANDVIANAVFGFECDSLKEPNNKFYEMGKIAADLTNTRLSLVLLGYTLVPKLFRFFKVTLYSNKITSYFWRLIKENIDSRKHTVRRFDMIGLLLETRTNKCIDDDEHSSIPDTGFAATEQSEISSNQKLRKSEISDKEIHSQAFVFFLAGFDSVSTLMCFMSYELGINQEVQDKLRKEVDATKKKCHGKVTYETITTMKYMDMVISETLRKWPTALSTDRICTKPYTIEPKRPNENPVHLDKGDMILIPIYSIQRDAQYYPDPERFYPERFNDENKSKLIPYTFVPFGVGPRNCIGSRFALLEAKVLFYYLLSNFEIVATEKTQIPFRFDKTAIGIAAEKGFWLGLQRRVKQNKSI